MSASNIQVAIKVRPILRKEKEQKQASTWKVAGNSIQQIEGQSEPFYFDHIFDQDICNQTIFDKMAKQIVDSGLKGFNGTIFAYGQTSSGKTYTMMGDDQNPGVMVLATKEIFKEIEKATDRQFLLRVGYIEIYNEKIYDLLNKSNQDLKIHETPNGDVSVNCSEYIITCEEDLLDYLCMGSKQRKIGETNMNERSSRSHAIFRIIIESRKTEKSDDDSVQISILNLVDLAGSERADQTRATGSRLKEGGHINKSLLFLSCVIKQLAEDRYVSYRDSKLTRILQASLGGNALTAIICTINPTAGEETLSTLNFANRAKVVKNKPQVNEVLSDAAMMKRLEKEINRLQNELEVEKTKNSQIKVGQIQKRLNEEILKIINSNSSTSSKAASDKRRRTWCPSSVTPPLVESNSVKTETFIPQQTMATQMPTKLLLPKSGMNFTPHITLRDVYYQNQLKEISSTPSIEEEFIPAEDVCFDEMLTPRTSPLKCGFQTPQEALKIRTASLTPRLTEKESLQKVERELKELEAFTNLENKLNVEHDTYNTLKYKLENAESVIARYEKERENFAFLKVEHHEAETNLSNCQKRIEELEKKLSEFEKASKFNAELIVRYEKEVTELKTTVTELKMENREYVSLDIEFQQHKTKSKLRETELLDALEEKQTEIDRLQRTLQQKIIEVPNNSKGGLEQIAKTLNETDSICVKCKDLQRIFAENKQIVEDFENVTKEYQTLQLHLEKVNSEAESAKLRADSLETENCSLKKNAEHLMSLHGTLEEVQSQISSLQAEKCKLESVRIEFEVMSKETANKISEKINISEEIQQLKTLKDNLTVERDSLLAEIAANNCIKEELNNLQTENNSLRGDIQAIKTKLETVQFEYANLMTENQSKSDSYEKLNMEVLSARNQLQTLQSEYRDIQQKYEQIQAECNKHEDTIGEIQCEYESIQNKYQSLQVEYEKLESDSVQSAADCDRVQNQNENLETEIKELKTKVEEAQRKLLENECLQLELESLKSEMNRLQGEYERNLFVKSDSNITSVKEDDLRQENAKLKQDLENLQQSFDEMQKEYDDISTQLVDNFSDFETLQGEVVKLEEELKKYKDTNADCLTNDLKAMQQKMDELQAENSHLVKENAEWKNTVLSMTDSMREKCDEREQLIAQLEESRNESARNDSSRSSNNIGTQFTQLAESFVEIEIPNRHGFSKIFQLMGAAKSPVRNRMIIGDISGITQGAFNELRGDIQFAISSDEHKCNAEIYDSLDIEDHSARANSCDSLDGASRRSSEVEINELEDDKPRLFERIRGLEGTIGLLKIEGEHFRTELGETQRTVDQLNGEKIHLSAICDESKCKINELNEIISRAECDNKKLIADCEQLKKAVESDYIVESVPRDTYEELKRKHEEVCAKLHTNETNISNCIGANGQQNGLPEEQFPPKPVNEIFDEHSTEIEKFNAESNVPECKCEEYKIEISQLKASKESLNNDETLLDESKTCVSVERQDDSDLKFALAELKISLEGKIKESAEGVAKLEDINERYSELKTEYDKVQATLSLETQKSAKLEKSLQNLGSMEEEVSRLNEMVNVLKEERNEVTKQKAVLEKEFNLLNEKLLTWKDKNDALQSSQDQLAKLSDKLRELEEINLARMDEQNKKTELLSELQKEKEELIVERDFLKKSANDLQEQVEKFLREHELLVRDKENLEKECHRSTAQLERLKEQYESNIKEKQDVQQTCQEIKENLNRVSAEKKRLQDELEETKQQHEKLKESHKSERAALEEKCSSLASEITMLSTSKTELQIALDKAKQHSEFLLQQGKDMEEQLNSELCTVRNSNNTMAQQIDELHEKIEKAEDDLKAVLDKTNSEKDQLITQLTNNNNILVTKGSELEEKFALLQTQLEDSKRTLLAEVQTKKALEKERLERDELIVQLSNKNDSLKEELDHQIEESKRSLATSEHQKDVLEKANMERDDLIVRLTNNNNSLATKSSELEEKLAILGNQFEESKRHLSTEVGRLTQLLTDANQLSNVQISKIEDLSNKISSLESDLKKSQATSEERDALLVKCNQFQGKLDALVVEHANLESTKSSLEVELNSARANVVENSKLKQRLSEMESTLKVLELKCNSLTSANEELQTSIKTLHKQLENPVQQKKLNDEIVKLQGELERTQADLTKSKEELNKVRIEWELQAGSFVEQTLQLKNSLKNATSERKSIQDKLEKAERTSLSKIAQLEQQIQTLTKEQSINLSKSISPKKEKGVDHLLGENHQLKVKNMSLMDKLDACQKSQNEERKNRRLSTHDERRVQSFWDNNRDMSTMTEPTNSECKCSELDSKLNEIKQNLLIRECQVKTLSMELKNHPLISENANLKKILIEEESKRYQLRQEIKKYKQLVVNKNNASRHCVKCAEAANTITVDSTTQTADYDESHRKLLSKYEDLKTICRARYTRIKELEDATGKENTNENHSSLHNHQYRQKYELLKKEYNLILAKYEEAKLLCNLRFEQIKNLSSQQSGNS